MGICLTVAMILLDDHDQRPRNSANLYVGRDLGFLLTPGRPETGRVLQKCWINSELVLCSIEHSHTSQSANGLTAMRTQAYGYKPNSAATRSKQSYPQPESHKRQSCFSCSTPPAEHGNMTFPSHRFCASFKAHLYRLSFD